MLQFAEEEIVIPEGRFKDLKFRADRNPWAGVLLSAIDDAIETRLYNRINTTGPSQQGKTFIGFVVPAMYHLFEIGETVAIGCPSALVWGDKWRSDLLPAIKKSQYRDLLPTTGKGSKDAEAPLRIDFKNGACLRVLTGGGDDKSVAGFTSRVLIVTETDGLGDTGGKSKEADKLKQMEARTKGWDDDSIHYYECTVSIERGKTWQMHKNGTESRLMMPCPRCHKFVEIERDCLKGWKDAEDEIQAAARSAIYCPACNKPWTDEHRTTAARGMRLVHRGQTITKAGKIEGPAPTTKTLSFRFNAAHSLFVKPGTIGAEEFKASRGVNVDNEEKEMRQFRWALPHLPTKEDLTKLDQFSIIKRIAKDIGGKPNAEWARGKIPPGYGSPYVGIDIGLRLAHWTCLTFAADGSPHATDYGVLTVPSDLMAPDEAILQTLRAFRDEVLLVGWQRAEELLVPDWTLIDTGYRRSAIYPFIKESGPGFMACKGFGETQDRGGEEKTRGGVIILGPNEGARDYEVVEFPDGKRLCEIGADRWKSYLHARLSTPLEQPGALTLFGPGDHLSFARHLVSEVQYEEFDSKRGTVVKWRRESKQNHWLDSTALAFVAGHLGGVRLAHEKVAEASNEPTAVAGAAPPPRNVQEVPQVY
jgi:hypothetical protein